MLQAIPEIAGKLIEAADQTLQILLQVARIFDRHLLDGLADPAVRATFREPAQALAQQYDLARNLNATLAVFDKLVT